MQFILHAPQQLNAAVHLPASKSISNRALIIHALSGGATQPENLSDCDDTEVVIDALKHNPSVIDIKAAGSAMRFMTAYLSVTAGEHTITGTARTQHRPIAILVDALRTLGANIEYEKEKGFPPLHIKGRQLDGDYLEVEGDVSSQYISALLMVGPMLKHGLELRLRGNIISRPYIDLTLWMMREYGADADWTGGDTIVVKPQPYNDRPYFIESDWSAASYWYELLALYGGTDDRVRLSGLMDASKQGDSSVKYIFSLLGVRTSFASAPEGRPAEVTLSLHPSRLQRLDYDFSNSPDLVQTFVPLCCALDIPFHFTGLSTLRIKETDRIEALKQELQKLGFLIRSDENSELIWEAGRCEPTMEPIDTYEDHRMALAFAPLAVKFPGLRINNPEVVSKSYPHYWDDLRAAGFTIEEA